MCVCVWVCVCVCVCVYVCVCIFCIIMLEHLSIYTIFLGGTTFSISMNIMCVCLFSALSHSVGALQISIIIISMRMLTTAKPAENNCHSIDNSDNKAKTPPSPPQTTATLSWWQCRECGQCSLQLIMGGGLTLSVPAVLEGRSSWHQLFFFLWHQTYSHCF